MINMDQDTIEIIHDMMATNHTGGVLLGKVFAYDAFIETFKSQEYNKHRAVIKKLVKLKSDLKEIIEIFEQQMATLQSEDKEVHLFLNRNYLKDVKEMKRAIALVEKILK